MYVRRGYQYFKILSPISFPRHLRLGWLYPLLALPTLATPTVAKAWDPNTWKTLDDTLPMICHYPWDCIVLVN